MPVLCEFYLFICLTTEEKHGKTPVRVTEEMLKEIRIEILSEGGKGDVEAYRR